MTVSENLKTQLKAAFSDFVTIGIDLFAAYAKELHRQQQEGEPTHVDFDSDDDKAVRAALLLDVNLDAGADEIRAALRRKLSSQRLHPDHGGDGDEAGRLIAAKNLLIERLHEAGEQ